MNDYLVTYDGGQDVWADDLSFMQNSLKSMIDTAVRTYGDNCILWGCLDSGKTNVVEGGVVISGKLYQVPALGAIGSNKLCFREVLSDERTFENQQVHKVKKQYEAYLSTDTSGAVAWIDLKTASKADGRVTELEGKVSTLESYNADSRLDELEGKVSTLESVNPTEWKNIPVTGEGLDGKVRYKIDKRTDTVILDVQIYTYSQYNNDISKKMFDWPSELSEYNNAMTVSVGGGSGGLYSAKSVCLRRGAKGMNVYDDSGPYTIPSNESISGTFLLSKNEQ